MFALNHPRPKPDPFNTRARMQHSDRERIKETDPLAERGKSFAAVLQRERPFDAATNLVKAQWTGGIVRSDTMPYGFDREAGAVLVGKTMDLELASQRMLLGLASAGTRSLDSQAFAVTYLDWEGIAEKHLAWQMPRVTDSLVLKGIQDRRRALQPPEPRRAADPKTFEGAPEGRFPDKKWGGWPPPPGGHEGFRAAPGTPNLANSPESGEMGQVQADQTMSTRVWQRPDPNNDNPNGPAIDPYRGNAYRPLQMQPGDRPDPGSEFRTMWSQGAGLDTIGGLLPNNMQPHLVKMPKPWTAVSGAGYGLPAPIQSTHVADPTGERGAPAPIPPEPSPGKPMLERPCSESGNFYEQCCGAKTQNGEWDPSCSPPVRSEWSEVLGWPIDQAVLQVQKSSPDSRVEALVAGFANFLPPDPRRISIIYDAQSSRVVEIPRRDWPLPQPKQDPAGLAMLVGQEAPLALNYLKSNYPSLKVVLWPNNIPLPAEGLPDRIIAVYNPADNKLTRVPFFG